MNGAKKSQQKRKPFLFYTNTNTKYDYTSMPHRRARSDMTGALSSPVFPRQRSGSTGSGSSLAAPAFVPGQLLAHPKAPSVLGAVNPKCAKPVPLPSIPATTSRPSSAGRRAKASPAVGAKPAKHHRHSSVDFSLCVAGQNRRNQFGVLTKSKSAEEVSLSRHPAVPSLRDQLALLAKKEAEDERALERRCGVRDLLSAARDESESGYSSESSYDSDSDSESDSDEPYTNELSRRLQESFLIV